ncbi:MAG: DUF819 family protein [Mongoliitalea sp.]
MLAYAAGVLIGNVGFFPTLSSEIHELLTLDAQQVKEAASFYLESGTWTSNDYTAFSIYQLQDTLMSVSILLALPLLLFSTNLKAFLGSAKSIIFSLAIAVFAVSVMVVSGFFVFKGVYGDQLWKISGMLVGVYTGGTPNLASLKLMLDVAPATYILIHSYDLVISFIYLVFLLSIGKGVFRWILPSFNSPNEGGMIPQVEEMKGSQYSLSSKESIISISKGLIVAVGVVGVSALIALQVPPSSLMVTIILMITSLSLLASLNQKIRKLTFSFETGMYLILIFSLVVASMVDIHSLVGITPGIFAYLAWVVFGSLVIQMVLSKLIKIDADTLMITSVAFICSPPFVPVLAGALKNRNIIMPGITIGVIGYALGNYLGFLMAEFLKNF